MLGIGGRWACWKAEAGFAGCGRCASELTETLRVLPENLTRFQHYASYKYQIKYPKHQIFTADTWYSAHMMIILSHISALEFWRSGKEFVLRRPDRFPEVDAIGEGAQNLTSSRIKKLRNQGFEFLSEPTHLLVPSDRMRSVRNNVVCHVCSRRIPKGSFIQICDGVYVCRPELAFVQATRILAFPAAVLTGFEICGAFRMSVNNQPALFQRSPLTTAAAIADYLEQCGGMHGIVEAKHAVRYVRDGSESPMEAKLVILLCFPISLGGYGIPLPVLNQTIPTTDAVRKATGRASFRCDLLWPQAGLAVEYDGADHGERIADDSIRRTALAELGVHTVVTVTKRQMQNEAELDLVVQRLKHCLGINRRMPTCDWSAQRAVLRRTLLYGDDSPIYS